MKIDLSKCAHCQKELIVGQEYWELQWEKKAVMSSCLTCWDKYNSEKKVWKKES
jgi:hypothetical protein